MDIHEERNDGFLVLGLEGRLDAVSSKMFEEKVLAVIDGGETQFVIDLSVGVCQQRGAQGFSRRLQAINSSRG